MNVLYSYIYGSAGREKTPRTPKPPRERRLTSRRAATATVVRILADQVKKILGTGRRALPDENMKHE
jgi:hypothetical protein